MFMCVEDVVSEFSRTRDRFDKLGIFYGALVLYIVFRRQENIVAGPLHMASIMVLDLFRDVLTYDELETFRCGVVKCVIALLKCPAFHDRTTRVIVLRQCVRQLVNPGIRMYVSILYEKIGEEIQKIKIIAQNTRPIDRDNLIGTVETNILDKLEMTVDEASGTFGLLIQGSQIYIPAPRIVIREIVNRVGMY